MPACPITGAESDRCGDHFDHFRELQSALPSHEFTTGASGLLKSRAGTHTSFEDDTALGPGDNLGNAR